MSGNFVTTARLMAKRAAAAERDRSGEVPTASEFVEHRSYVLSGIVASVAFLEAAINEVFQDAEDGDPWSYYLEPVGSPAIETLAAIWRGTGDGRRLQILEKWQTFLLVAGFDQLDKGADPYQQAALLIGLRNALVHYKAENWISGKAHKLEEQLADKFPPNPLVESAVLEDDPTNSVAWWPELCLGAGCAEWAAQSASAFVRTVLNRTKLDLPCQQIPTALLLRE